MAQQTPTVPAGSAEPEAVVNLQQGAAAKVRAANGTRAPQLDGDDRLHKEIERRAEKPADMSAADRASADAKAFRSIEKPYMQESAAVVMTDSGRAAPAYREALATAAPDVAQRVAALDKQAEARMMAKEDRKQQQMGSSGPVDRREIDRWVVQAHDHKPAEFKDAKNAAAAYDAIDAEKSPSVARVMRDGSAGISAETVGVDDRREKSVGSSDQAFARAYLELQQQRQVRIEVSATTAASRGEPEGVRLESLGKGVSTADVDPKAQQVVIRRSGRVIERLADEKAVGEFADKKGLSAEDRETLLKLAAVRAADDPEREAAKASIGKDAQPMDSMVNTLSQAAERGRVRAEVQQNDAQVYEWIERQRQLRAQQETGSAAATARPSRAVEGSQTIERQGPLAAPDTARAIPPEVGSQFTRDGDKYYHQQSKAVAFVDRGDKLSTPASTPKMAEALVKVAEARGWDEVRVQGTEGFRREVWLEASSRGMHVDGYTPTDRDKSELEKRNAFTRDQNTIQVRSQAFKQLPPDQGVQRDPSLASAYALVQAAEAFAQARLAEKDRQQFVTAVRAKVADDLQAGRPVPVVQIRTPARESAREFEQTNERVR